MNVPDLFKVLGPNTPGKEWEARFRAALAEREQPETIVQALIELLEKEPENCRFLYDDKMPLLLDLLSSGPYARALLMRFPHWWNWLKREDEQAASRALLDYERRYHDFFREDACEPQAALRRFRARENLRIGLRLIRNRAPIERTSFELALLAETLCRAALDLSQEQVTSRFGSPSSEAEGFFLLGMGKLGGRELNFSSDIDLIPLYRTDQGNVIDSRGRASEISLHEYYSRLTEIWVKALSEVTADGFVYRVDLRLRPEGVKGPLVNSLRSADQYYETWGTLWERAAYLKARPIAGDEGLALEFLHGLEPFIYRRHLDFHVLEEIQRLKQLIAQDLARRQPDELDLKLGAGGIREVEFFVQAHQLIHGGREHLLRSPTTLTTLQNLFRLQLIKEEEAQDLAEAYQFLRKLEDLVQFHENQQTHRLPKEGPWLRQLARFMGFTSSAALLGKLDQHRARVHALFESLLEERTATQPKLFASPRTQEILLMLRENFDESAPSDETMVSLQRAALVLGQELDRRPDWRRFLKPLDSLFRRLGHRVNAYDEISAHPEIVDRLFSILQDSEFLTEILLARPGLILSLGQNDAAVVQGGGSPRLLPSFQHAADRGEAMEILRTAKSDLLFRTGFLDLFGTAGLLATQNSLTDFAEHSLEQVAAWILAELEPRYGAPCLDDSEKPCACCLVGLGSLGARELSYRSDLDLIFIYEGPGETRGPKRVTNQEFFTLFGQRLLSFLTTATAQGAAYSVDTRLRPSGNAGTLVTSRDAFLRYHKEQSQLWEVQSLLRARPLTGDAAFRAQLMSDFSRLIFRPRKRQALSKELHQMRKRVEGERAKHEFSENLGVDLKLGEGGLMDVEFATQFLQLIHGGPHLGHTRLALQQLGADKALPLEQVQILVSAYDEYRHLLNRIVLISNHSQDSLYLGLPRLDEIARSLSHEDSRSLLETLQHRTGQVRKIYLDILGLSD